MYIVLLTIIIIMCSSIISISSSSTTTIKITITSTIIITITITITMIIRMVSMINYVTWRMMCCTKICGVMLCDALMWYLVVCCIIVSVCYGII